MKKILFSALFATVTLSGCHHNPDWHYDCNRNYSEDSSTYDQCKARVEKMKAAGAVRYGSPSGGVGLRPDISGARQDERIGSPQGDN